MSNLNALTSISHDGSEENCDDFLDIVQLILVCFLLTLWTTVALMLEL